MGSVNAISVNACVSGVATTAHSSCSFVCHLETKSWGSHHLSYSPHWFPTTRMLHVVCDYIVVLQGDVC